MNEPIIAIATIITALCAVLALVFNVYREQHQRFRNARKLSDLAIRYCESEPNSEEWRQLRQQLVAEEQLTDAQIDGLPHHWDVANAFKTLHPDTYSTTYRYLLERINIRFRRLIHEPKPRMPGDRLQRPLARHLTLFSDASYRFCLKLALFYPLVLTFASWWLAGNIQVGELALLPETDFGVRTLLIGYLVFMTGFIYFLYKKDIRWYWKVGAVAGTIAIALTVRITDGDFVVAASGLSVIFAIATAFVITCSFSAAGALALIDALIFAVAAAVVAVAFIGVGDNSYDFPVIFFFLSLLLSLSLSPALSLPLARALLLFL